MQDLRTKLAALGSLLIVIVAGGCASPVPGQVGVSGKVLNVTIQCSGQMSSANSYYFVINRVGLTGDAQGRGPIPVLGQNEPYIGYGNGFATGSLPINNNMTNGVTDYGLSDFVVYNIGQPNTQIGVYHINVNQQDPNSTLQPGVYRGSPAGGYTLPDPTSTTGTPNVLQFTLPLTQLVDPTGKTQAQITTEANNIHYLQCNIIATNVVSNISDTGKQVDSMGNSTLAQDLGSFLLIDVTQNKQINSNGPFPVGGFSYPEQTGDLYPPGSPSNDTIDLVYWSITVSQQ